MSLLAALLVLRNEVRLLMADPVGIFMLILAPIVIIAVAGFSLGNLYGTRRNSQEYVIPIIDQDHGRFAAAVLHALGNEPEVKLVRMADRQAALRAVGQDARTPLAIVIPAGASGDLEQGRPVTLELYADPVKRFAAKTLELRLDQLTAELNAAAEASAQQQLNEEAAVLKAEVGRDFTTVQAQLEALERQANHERRRVAHELDEQLAAARHQAQASLTSAIAAAQTSAEQSLAPRRAALAEVRDYLVQLRQSQNAFEQWFAQLRVLAGKHAAQIPPPPHWPSPPSPAVIAELSAPPPKIPPPPLTLAAPDQIRIPKQNALSLVMPTQPTFRMPQLPGAVGWREYSFAGGATQTNAFDQYVPGFGITFLLIGMLMGLSMGLIDDRDWGTLARLQLSGASFPAILLGKLVARMIVGFIQLVLLFAAGWILFDVALGPSPAALLLPALAIAFAAAAFGLIIPCVSRTHDSVMPVGAVAAMAMAAIGGCWWPLDLEPGWLRAVAEWMPTTWTMQAFNDLMIRQLGPGEILDAVGRTAGLGLLYLLIGLAGVSKIYRVE